MNSNLRRSTKLWLPNFFRFLSSVRFFLSHHQERLNENDDEKILTQYDHQTQSARVAGEVFIKYSWYSASKEFVREIETT